MLNDFAQEKETLTLKNRIFQSPKNCIYPKRLTQAFDEKNAIFVSSQLWSKEDYK